MRPGAWSSLGRFVALMTIGLAVTGATAIRNLYRRIRGTRNTNRGE